MTSQVTPDAAGHYRVSGSMTFDTVTELYEGAELEFEAGGELTLDLDEVTRADSAGLALLLEWARRGRRNNCRLRLKNLPDQLRLLMEVTGLEAAFSESR